MKKFAYTLFAATAILASAVPSAGAQDAEVLRIGILAPLSGPFERLGRQVEQGVALGIERLRLDPDSVEIISVDDECDEERGRDAANQLIGADVDVVIGGVCWRPAVAARDVFAFAGLPFVSSGVRYGPFTDDADGPVFRLAGRDDAQAAYLADALTQGALDGLLGGSATNRPIALFYTDGNYGRTLAEALEDHLRRSDVRLALTETFVADGDLDAVAANAQAENAGLVVIFAGQADSALLAQALRARLPEVALLAADSVMTAEFRLLAAEGSEEMVFARPTAWDTLVDDDVRRGLEADEDGAASGLVLPSIAATEIAVSVLNDDQAPYDTVLGSIEFDGAGDANLPSFQLWQWRQGYLWPYVPDDEFQNTDG